MLGAEQVSELSEAHAQMSQQVDSLQNQLAEQLQKHKDLEKQLAEKSQTHKDLQDRLSEKSQEDKVQQEAIDEQLEQLRSNLDKSLQTSEEKMAAELAKRQAAMAMLQNSEEEMAAEFARRQATLEEALRRSQEKHEIAERSNEARAAQSSAENAPALISAKGLLWSNWPP